MARPEQATGHELQSLSGFVTSSPFSQPPKSTPHPPQPRHHPHPPLLRTSSSGAQPHPTIAPASANNSASSSATTPHERLPGPSTFPTASPVDGPAAGIRRPSGVPMPIAQAPEKTAIGRSSVFEEIHGRGDPFYRRHSVDMGVAIASKAHMNSYSPPQHHRYQQPQQQQQQHFATHGRSASRSGGASPHPLSFDQTASGLSSGTPGSASPSHSPTERGIKRPAQDGFSSSNSNKRFGGGNAPSSYSQSQQPQQQQQQAQAQAQAPSSAQQQRQQFYPSQANGVAGSSGKGNSSSGMGSYASPSDPRAYSMSSQSGTHQQQQSQPFGATAPLTLAQPSQPGAKADARSPGQQSPHEDYNPKNGYPHSTSGPRNTERSGGGSWRQQGPPPGNSLGITNGPLPPPQPHPHPHMRLPPIELAPPRRHSLAVTTHLERYRARDASPPPSNEHGPQRMPMQPSSYARTRAQPLPMSPLHEGPSAGPPPQAPPASFLNYAPVINNSNRRSPPLPLKSVTASAASQLPKPQLPAPNPLPPSATAPAANGGGSSNVGSLKKPMFSSPLKSVVPQISSSAAQSSEHPSSLAPVRVPDNHDAGDSRRTSEYGGIEHIPVPDTRRSSIIALTNPQSEADVRAENMDLKRRLDAMEYKYLKEIESLKTTVRELEIEKSLLKSLLIEKSVNDMSASTSPLPSHMVLSNPQQQEREHHYGKLSPSEMPTHSLMSLSALSAAAASADLASSPRSASSPTQQKQQQQAVGKN
ncbi:hypothetical protein GGI12_003756 [Dipsacomyces acuminosporus]|nr:hypothetical protein GGI12_003756 [Dipsacomyces acuminosporus]